MADDRGRLRDDAGPGRRRRASVPAFALLPLRIFLGITFLYAGLDKLIDPAFFDASSAASIQSQLVTFTRASPIAELIRLVEPFAVPIGLSIAIAEIGIGIGALSGLAFRVAATAGLTLSVMFWLTASWATRPFYYGPDLPYAAGWLTLALAGTGGLLVPERLRAWRGASRSRAEGPQLERRMILQTGLLAVAAVVVASLAVPLRMRGGQIRDPAPPTPSPSSVADASPAAGIAIATVASVQRTGSASFTIPFDAPAPLPAGDPGIIVQLPDGTFVAFDATCTHQGCTVEWDSADKVIVCPCHAAVFDAADRAAVLQGPTDQPLASLPLVVDLARGTILLRI